MVQHLISFGMDGEGIVFSGYGSGQVGGKFGVDGVGRRHFYYLSLHVHLPNFIQYQSTNPQQIRLPSIYSCSNEFTAFYTIFDEGLLNYLR